MKKLVVIDGKSVFYRGYYAMGALSMQDGTPTSGVYGFAVIAMEIVRRLKPDKVVVAWDKAKTSTSKRLAIYKDYKAGRVKPPEDFFAQIPILRELIEALGWGFLECDGYEADDIIGTLARQAGEKGWETDIISSDLDMLQVVDENTKMYRVLRGFSKIEEMDVQAVEEKYGIRKEQFLDLKAIKGDQSDNIPGVPGIGEKGAAKLLEKYGDIDEIYENLDEIGGKTAEKLSAGKESAYMSKELGRIMTDAPVTIAEIPDFKIDGARILKELNKLEFRTVVRRFETEILGNMNAEEEEVEVDAPELPEDVIVEWDVKAKMHEDEKIRREIFGGKKFWDLAQGRFLLNPLARKPEKEPDKRQEYWRQRREFGVEPKLFKIFMEYDLPLIPVLYEMEAKGILIDGEYFRKLRDAYGIETKMREEEIWKLAGRVFNVNSPAQLGEVLFNELELPTKGIKRTARGYSTGARELEKLRELHPVVEKILEYREAAKLLNTYIMPMPDAAGEDGRVHTTFTQDVTATGRLSSVNPNLQNIPVRTEAGRKIRRGFIAEEGKVLISADYSQFELRLAAVLAGDEKLIADFNAGVDIHTKTAAEVFKVGMDEVSKRQRRAAKVINFGVLYGMSAKGLADAAGMSVTEAKQFIEDYFKLRSPIREYLDRILRQAKEKGYVETFYGRRRPTPDVRSSNFMIRTGAERAAQNMPIQGTEADLMKRAMIKMEQKLKGIEGAEMILQIHDSLVVEGFEKDCDTITTMLRETMEGVAPELGIKLAVDVTMGKNWGEL